MINGPKSLPDPIVITPKVKSEDIVDKEKKENEDGEDEDASKSTETIPDSKESKEEVEEKSEIKPDTSVETNGIDKVIIIRKLLYTSCCFDKYRINN